MRLRDAFGVGLALVVGGILAIPLAIPRLAATKGVTVGGAGWCATGLCLADVKAPAVLGLTAAHLAIDWDRTVRVVDAVVALRGSGATGGGAHGVVLGGLTGWVREVDVDGLTVRDAPLPSLSGELLPERHLRGTEVTVDGDVTDATLDTPYGRVHVRAAPAPGGLAMDADAERVTLPASVLGEAVTVPAVHAHGTYADHVWSGTVGALALDIPAVVDVTAGTATLTLVDVPLADLYQALGDVVPEATRAHIDGTASGVVTLSNSGLVRISVDKPAIDGFRVTGLVDDRLHDQFTYATRDADGNPVSRDAGPALPGWTPLDRIGALLPAAVIAAEDSTFATHPGYDLKSMLDAAGENEALGRVKRGGSTLTQQLAKNLYLDGTRTYVRKLRELLYAVNLEDELGKRGILETYLNIVEFGPGIYGAAAASDRYFLKSPAGLLPEEAAWLASVLPGPTAAWKQQYLRDRPNRTRVDAILDNMLGLPKEERERAKGRAIHFVR